EDRYREVAVRVLVPLAPAMAQQPSAFGHLLCALDDLVGPLYEVAIIGTEADPHGEALQQVLASRYLPRLALAAAPESGVGASSMPLLKGRTAINKKPAAYVCRSFVCRQPVTQPEELLALLEG